MHKFTTIIDAHYLDEKLTSLNQVRSISTVPVFGNYKMIDFILSNIQGAGGRLVAIYSSPASRSLHDHLDNGKPWDLSRNKDGLFYFNSIQARTDENVFMSYDRIFEHVEYIEKSTAPYILIVHSHGIVNFDIQAALEEHVQSGKQISKIEFANHKNPHYFILSKEVLEKIGNEYKMYRDVNIIDTFNHDLYSKNVIEIDKKYYSPNCIEDYHKLQLGAVNNYDKLEELVTTPNDIRTKPNVYRGALVYKHGKVNKAIVANGSEIDGQVDNSVLFKKVRIDQGAIVENSVIFAGTHIKAGAIVKNAVIDKKCEIESNVKIIGDTHTVYIPKKAKVEEDIWK